MIVKRFNNEKPSTTDGLSYDNYVLSNLLRQISVNINGTFVSNSNLSNNVSYIQVMLMTLMSYKKLRGLVN